jgi:hypothetical protein
LAPGARRAQALQPGQVLPPAPPDELLALALRLAWGAQQARVELVVLVGLVVRVFPAQAETALPGPGVPPVVELLVAPEQLVEPAERADPVAGVPGAPPAETA